MKKIVMISMIIGILTISISMIYYFVIFLPKKQRLVSEMEQKKKSELYDECIKNCDSQDKCKKYGTQYNSNNNNGGLFSGSHETIYCVEKTNYGACHNDCLKNYK